MLGLISLLFLFNSFTYSLIISPKTDASNQVVAYVGESFILTCISNETGPIEWKRNQNETVLNSYISSGYSLKIYFAKVLPSDAGVYTCFSNNKSVSINLILYKMIMFVNTPSEQILTSSNSFIKCNVSSYPQADVVWFRSGYKLENNDKYQMLKNGLVIRFPREDDTGIYICQAHVLSTGNVAQMKIRVRVKLDELTDFFMIYDYMLIIFLFLIIIVIILLISILKKGVKHINKV